jgi:hypothetical protein
MPPRRHRWPRRALFRTVETAARLAGGRRFYRSVFLTSPRLRERREDVAVVAGLPEELLHCTIAHLSDFHGGPFLRSRDLLPLVERVNALEPDVIALTGDFMTHRTEEGIELIGAFAGLRARRGIFAVFGNHDYRRRREGEMAEAMARLGIVTLRNAHAMVMPQLAIAGIEDMEEGKVSDLDAALDGVPPGAVRLLLSHHPGALASASERGVSLVLSGHTHGGQVNLPILRRLGPPHPGDRIERGSTTLLVNHGIGAIGVPFRWKAPAEIVVARLVRKL